MKVGIFLGQEKTKPTNGSISNYREFVGKRFEFHKCNHYKDTYRMGRNVTDNTAPPTNLGDGLAYYIHEDDIRFGNILNK